MLLFTKKVIIFMVIICFVNAQLMVRTSYDDDDQYEDIEENGEISDYLPQVKDKLSSDELKEIYETSKDISHSKGKVVKSKDGELEYRRSFLRKVSVAVNTNAVEKLLKKLMTGDLFAISAFEDLEYLVHQYDVALEFVSLTGIEKTLLFLRHKNKDVKAAALSVLTAAMQGNPDVQRYAASVPLLEYLMLDFLTTKEIPLPGLFYALSSYLRNMPNSQIKFLKKQGIQALADILKRKEVPLKSKLKIINLFGDMAVEIQHPDLIQKNPKISLKLKKLFADGILQTNLCEKIPEYLAANSYQVLENIISDMNNLHPFCISQFESETVYRRVKELMDVYNPISNVSWFPDVDTDLKSDLFDSLKSLHMNIKRRNKIKKNAQLEKMEL